MVTMIQQIIVGYATETTTQQYNNTTTQEQQPNIQTTQQPLKSGYQQDLDGLILLHVEVD